MYVRLRQAGKWLLMHGQDPVWKHRKDRNDKTTDPSFDYEAWKVKHTAFADVAVPRWVAAVKEKFGKPETKYACVG